MIVFDLKCSGDHIFEAWFASSSDYEEQKARDLLACPICGDPGVAKAVMAPAVGAKSNRGSGSSDRAVPVGSGPDMAKMRAIMERLAEAQGEALKDSDWVGRQFAETARAMHYGEQDHRTIHGEVAADEARALVEEGVEVAPLLFPVVPPDLQN